MTNYEIVCVNAEKPHDHIISVGTKRDDEPVKVRSVKWVRRAIKNGDGFYTRSPKTQKTAEVERYECEEANCGFKTIRSAADATRKNNLNGLDPCEDSAAT